jgi:hypothetical protein
MKNKELLARYRAAPEEVRVEVRQPHIDLCAGMNFHFTENPVAAALHQAGWHIHSIGIAEAYIGGADTGVLYLPCVLTSETMNKWWKHRTMSPFRAEFKRMGIPEEEFTMEMTRLESERRAMGFTLF